MFYFLWLSQIYPFILTFSNQHSNKIHTEIWLIYIFLSLIKKKIDMDMDNRLVVTSGERGGR